MSEQCQLLQCKLKEIQEELDSYKSATLSEKLVIADSHRASSALFASQIESLTQQLATITAELRSKESQLQVSQDQLTAKEADCKVRLDEAEGKASELRQELRLKQEDLTRVTLASEEISRAYEEMTRDIQEERREVEEERRVSSEEMKRDIRELRVVEESLEESLVGRKMKEGPTEGFEGEGAKEREDRERQWEEDQIELIALREKCNSKGQSVARMSSSLFSDHLVATHCVMLLLLHLSVISLHPRRSRLKSFSCLRPLRFSCSFPFVVFRLDEVTEL